jgi:hypothetical protein
LTPLPHPHPPPLSPSGGRAGNSGMDPPHGGQHPSSPTTSTVSPRTSPRDRWFIPWVSARGGRTDWAAAERDSPSASPTRRGSMALSVLRPPSPVPRKVWVLGRDGATPWGPTSTSWTTTPRSAWRSSRPRRSPWPPSRATAVPCRSASSARPRARRPRSAYHSQQRRTSSSSRPTRAWRSSPRTASPCRRPGWCRRPRRIPPARGVRCRSSGQ